MHVCVEQNCASQSWLNDPGPSSQPPLPVPLPLPLPLLVLVPLPLLVRCRNCW
jgi:hypothetical protein